MDESSYHHSPHRWMTFAPPGVYSAGGEKKTFRKRRLHRELTRGRARRRQIEVDFPRRHGSLVRDELHGATRCLAGDLNRRSRWWRPAAARSGEAMSARRFPAQGRPPGWREQESAPGRLRPGPRTVQQAPLRRGSRGENDAAFAPLAGRPWGWLSYLPQGLAGRFGPANPGRPRHGEVAAGPLRISTFARSLAHFPAACYPS
jgi:hypothetical protein